MAAVPASIGIVAFAVIRGSRGRVAVEAGEAGRKDLRTVVSASGEVKPRRYAEVSASVSGRIASVLVAEGDTVRRGQVLAQIDSTRHDVEHRRSRAALASALAELRRTEAEVQAIRASFEQTRRLHAEELASDEALADASARLAAGEALVESQRRRVKQYESSPASDHEDLDRAVLVAPMDGVVTDLRKQPGEVVIGAQSFQPTVIMTVADLASMEVEVLVDEADIRSVHVGQPADVRVRAVPGVPIHGRVSAIGSSAVARGGGSGAGDRPRGSRDFRVTITLENPPPGLRPGLGATAEITTAKRTSALAVPREELRSVTPATLVSTRGAQPTWPVLEAARPPLAEQRPR
jgi:HlyD family secretion protein